MTQPRPPLPFRNDDWDAIADCLETLAARIRGAVDGGRDGTATDRLRTEMRDPTARQLILSAICYGTPARWSGNADPIPS
jgi:hypothetical protein